MQYVEPDIPENEVVITAYYLETIINDLKYIASRISAAPERSVLRGLTDLLITQLEPGVGFSPLGPRALLVGTNHWPVGAFFPNETGFCVFTATHHTIQCQTLTEYQMKQARLAYYKYGDWGE